jgi:replicative DNA helicase
MTDMAPTIALAEVDVEDTLIGSIITFPDVLGAIAGDVDPDWFTDPHGRALVEAALELHRNGHKVSAAALAAALPPVVESRGITRSAFVAGLMTQAMPVPFISAYISTLRDRWARRQLKAQGERLIADAEDIASDPFEVAAATIADADFITSSRREIAAGPLGESVDALLSGDHLAKGKSATTGIRSLDEVFGGYASGKMYVVAGRPGMGKSAFACASLRATAEAGSGVAMFSLEMGREEVAARCLASAIGGINGPFYGSILRGQTSEMDDEALVEAAGRLRKLPLHVDASPGLAIGQIAARARRRKAAFEAKGIRLGVVAIDHLGLVSASDRYRGNKVAETGEVSRACKNLAKELDCAVLLLCQLNREVEGRDDKRPGLSDLRWSGDIEQDADVVAFVYRAAYYLNQRPDADPEQLHRARYALDFLIRKNRNGECREVPLWCSIAHSAIKEAA